MPAPLNNKNNYRHGLSHTRLDNIYKAMISRCYIPQNSSYKYYGARGISVCVEWIKDKKLFFEWSLQNGYQENLSIDRIDSNGNYEPNNCRWVSMKTQQNNRTNNRIIEFNGEVKTLSEWSDCLGIKPATIWARLKRGDSIERAFRPLNEVNSYVDN